MTLLHCDGFDHYGTDTTNMTDGIYSQVDASFTLSASNPRTGNYSLNRASDANDNSVIFTLPETNETLAAGFVFYPDQLPNSNYSYPICSFLDSTDDEQITFVVNSDGSVSVLSGGILGNEIGVSSTNIVQAGEYNHIECAATASADVTTIEYLYFSEYFNNGLTSYVYDTDYPENFSIVEDDSGDALQVDSTENSTGDISRSVPQSRLSSMKIKFKILDYGDDDTAVFRIKDTSGTNILSIFPLREKAIDAQQRCQINSPSFGAGQFLSSARLDLSTRYRVDMQVNTQAMTIDAQLYNDETETEIGSVSDVAISSFFITNEIAFETAGPGAPNDTDGTIIFDDIELYTLISDNPGGIVEVRVNGVTVISESNVATRDGAEDSYSAVALSFGSTFNPGVTTYIDDFYVWNDQGAWNNSFLGDRRCYFIKPNQDTNIADFDPSSGSFGYKMIDDDSPDDDTTYIIAESYLLSGSPLSGTSEFGIENISDGSSLISAVNVVSRAAKTDSTSAELYTSITTGADSLSSDAHILTTSYQYYSDIFEYSPSTIASLTKDIFNSMSVSVTADDLQSEFVSESPTIISPTVFDSPFTEGSPTDNDGDPYFANVVSLLHFEGVDTSTVFTDVIGNTWVTNGNAQIDTAQFKFGSASGLFDGSGDYLYSNETTEFDIGTQDFTIEAWVRPNSVTGVQEIFARQAQSALAIQLRLNGNKPEILIRGSGGGTVYMATSATSITTGAWHHVAGVRSGDNLYIFLNGILEGSDTGVNSVDLSNASAPATVAAVWDYPGSVSAYINGWLDELRVTVGIARYTADFTPPTTEFPDG